MILDATATLDAVMVLETRREDLYEEPGDHEPLFVGRHAASKQIEKTELGIIVTANCLSRATSKEKNIYNVSCDHEHNSTYMRHPPALCSNT